MDTVTLLGAGIRGVLRVADERLEAELRGVLTGGEEYASLAKPQIDWDDQAARAALVERRARDARAVLGILAGRSLTPAVDQATQLLAAVVGKDLEQGGDGVFRIARKVATDRVISVVDPDARHGHKSSARGFDGYKGHASVDPDSELVLATTATAANIGDAAAAPGLLAELVDQVDGRPPAPPTASTEAEPQASQPAAYGDSAYGTGPLLASLHAASIDPFVKVQAAVAPGGHFTRTSSTSILPPAPSPARPSTPPRSFTAPIRTTATTARQALAQRVRAARCGGSAPTRRGAGLLPSPPTRRSWPLLAPARPTLSAPPITAPPDPRWSESSPTWSVAATAAAGSGSAAWPGSPPTSTCWPPRSTWPGWACWACTGPHRMAGWRHELTRRTDQRQPRRTATRALPRPARQPTPRTVGRCSRRHARPRHSLTSMARFTPAT